MINQLIQLLLMALASIIVMILHELPKAMIYANTYNKVNKNYGKIREPLSKDEEVKKQDKDIMYSNMGELKL